MLKSIDNYLKLHSLTMVGRYGFGRCCVTGIDRFSSFREQYTIFRIFVACGKLEQALLIVNLR
jgi:hypothetical protein